MERHKKPHKGGGATTLSIIREIQERHKGKEAPHNGGAIFPKDVQVTPFSPKGLLNPNMNNGVLRELMAFQVAMSTSTMAT
jgi:hypothetical protein